MIQMALRALPFLSKGIPFPWLLSLVLCCLLAFQHQLLATHKAELSKAQLQVVAFDQERENILGRADQATKAAVAQQKAASTYKARMEALQASLNKCQREKVKQVASSALKACQQAHDHIRSTLYE